VPVASFPRAGAYACWVERPGILSEDVAAAREVSTAALQEAWGQARPERVPVVTCKQKPFREQELAVSV